MQIISNPSDLLKILCKSAKKYGMMICPNIPFEEALKQQKELGYLQDAPYLSYTNEAVLEHTIAITCNGVGYMLFENEAEMRKYYGQTRGDESGGCCYALTCGPDGEFMGENT